jgi:hypothetical protein
MTNRQRISEKLLADLASVWEAHGESVLKRLALTDPGKLATIAYGLLPRDLFISVQQQAPGGLAPDGTDASYVGNPVTDYVPSARPGGRAPHIWLEGNGTRSSIIVGNGFALLTAAGGKAWSEAANELATEYPLHLETRTIDDSEFMSAYDLDESGAVLVRPDGYVGWRSRSKTSDPSRTLREAMAGMLGRKI